METLGRCPVCRGTGHMPCPDNLRNKNGWYGYREKDDTVTCRNCGGQTMMLTATGMVFLRRDNHQPCIHEVDGTKIGNCLYKYTCKHCNYSYDIDSGD